MCGIVGLVGVDAPLERCQDLVVGMASQIRHRGPDGGGIATHPDATVGMVRLAIVDVVHGHQPMANEDESIVMVYNGEVYNAPLIRRELEQRGVQFRTHSDTEVILRLYENDPEHVEERLVGMWAFAIHDRRRRRIILSRDRFGIKPLFVADAGTALAFASELRCFDKSLPQFSRLFAIDHEAAHAMVSWSYVPENSTIYQGVKRVPPATRLTIDLTSGRREARTYWSLEPSAEAARVRSLDQACEQVDALLRRAVREHLESDVPVATFLSGGIDSSLITAYAHEESRAPIKAYSIGFAERSFDESPFAGQTAQKIGVPLLVEMFDENKARARLVDAVLAYDEPFGDASSLATHLLSHHVARDFKVALGGDGGDEVFAGYKRYTLVQLRGLFAGTPRLRNWTSRALARLPLNYERPSEWTPLLRKVRLVATGLDGDAAQAYVRLSQWAPLARTGALMRTPASAVRFEEQARARFNQARGTELQKYLASDLADLLCNDILVKVDRASMSCGLEARVPFLDHRVVEFGVGLPQAFTAGPRSQGFIGKRVLRALHARRFGPELARRKKQGFSVPMQQWLQGPFSGACERLFDRKRLDHFGVLSPAALSNGRHRRWLHGSTPELIWHAFALAAWCESALGDGPDALRDVIQEGAVQARAPIATAVSAAGMLH